jgi:hypothetical protein
MLKPIKFFDNLIDRFCAALGAVALSQFPQFYGQYMQRLGGHLDETKRALDQYIKVASDLGLTLEEYIIEHLNSSSEIFKSSGRIIEDLLTRYNELNQTYNALQEANIYNRWFVFLKEVDWSIAVGTWNNFMPGIPTTIEGLTYALAGLLAGWGTYSIVKLLIAFPFRKRPQKLKFYS